jgi:hypothetical protein
MKKPVYLLLGILLLFVIIYLLLVQKEEKTFAPGMVENFLELDSAVVDRIEFKKYDTKMVFQKAGQQWYIVSPDSFRADNKAIGQMISLASHLTVGDIISSNPEKQFFFQVDALTGTQLDFLSGDRQLASMVVGKMSDDFTHAYLRKTGSEDVYLAEGIFSGITKQRIESWRDRQILTFNPQQIKEIEISKEKKRFKLTREDTSWSLSPHPYQQTMVADNQKAEDYVRTLADIKADKFAYKGEAVGLSFQNPELEITLSFLDDQQKKLWAIKAWGEENRYYVKTDRIDEVYVLFEYNLKRLAKQIEDFQPQEEKEGES